MTHKFSSYIITETSLGAQCAEILLTEGHQVLGVISNNQDVIKWALKHNIPYFLTLKEFEKLKPEQSFDYLFSIVNNQILPSKLLKYPCYFAIDYHDAALPKYAGVHATSWAILNNEKSHGISWHVMSSLVDTGDILKQITFPIETDETTLTLNLKCYTQAIETFRVLVKELAEGTAHKQPQDLQDKSYYSAHQKPDNAGVVDWDGSAQDIDKLYRALYFGNYPNKLTSFKFLIDQQIFFPHKLEILKEKTKAKSGTIVKINAESLQITTKTEDILIGDITDTEGNSYTLSYLTNNFNLYEGYELPILNKRIKSELLQQLEGISPYEDYWVKSLLQSTPAKLPFMSSVSKIKNKQAKKIQDNQSYSFIISEIDKKTIKSASERFKKVPFVDVLTAVLMIYLSRLGNKGIFRVDYTEPFLRQITTSLGSFLSSEVPLTIDSSGSLTGGEVVQKIAEEKARIIKHKTYSLDVKERHPILNRLSYERPDIKINVVESELGVKGFQTIRDHFLEIDIDSKGERYTLVFSQELSEIENQFIGAIPSQILC